VDDEGRLDDVSSARQQIEAWRTQAAGETVVSASAVQDRLFDLWGEVRDTPAAAVVEQWLTLTVERQLFAGPELVEFLDGLERSLLEGVSTP
jgi:hypothetical protein